MSRQGSSDGYHRSAIREMWIHCLIARMSCEKHSGNVAVISGAGSQIRQGEGSWLSVRQVISRPFRSGSIRAIPVFCIKESISGIAPGLLCRLRLYLPFLYSKSRCSSLQVRLQGVPEMMKGTGWPPGLLLSPVRVPGDGTGIFLWHSILQQETCDRHG